MLSAASLYALVLLVMAGLPDSVTTGGGLHQFHEPQARYCHCCGLVGQNIYIYGHHAHMSVPPCSGIVEVFNLPSGMWQQLPTTGPPPQGVEGLVCAVVENCIYFFGGGRVVDGEVCFYNSVHELDVTSMLWKKLGSADQVTAPMVKAYAGIIYYESSLSVFSGYGLLPADYHSRPADYVLHSTKYGWTNELHLFNLQSRTWSVPVTSGIPPPACAGCSFTRVDEHRGVVFGGLQKDRLPNHFYILNFQFWVKMPFINTLLIKRGVYCGTTIN